MAEEFWTVAQAAAHFDVTTVTIRSWCRRGLLDGAFKAGSGHRAPWLIPVSALEGFKPPKPGRPKERE